MFYCMFYFTCDRDDDISSHSVQNRRFLFMLSCRLHVVAQMLRAISDDLCTTAVLSDSAPDLLLPEAAYIVVLRRSIEPMGVGDGGHGEARAHKN